MKKQVHLLLMLFLLSILQLKAQQYFSKIGTFSPGGEFASTSQRFGNGTLLESYQVYNSPQPGYTVRRLDVNDVVLHALKFPHASMGMFFHTVITTQSRIFVIGAPWASSVYDFNVIVMDSSFNILHQKNIQLPYTIVGCEFFPAYDGGVIGTVWETCNEERYMRLDSTGSVIWTTRYRALDTVNNLLQSPGPGKINMIGNGRYILSTYYRYGYGLLFLKFDDNSNIIDYTQMKLVPQNTVGLAEWVRRTTIDDDKLLVAVDVHLPDSTYLIQLDTSLNVLQVREVVMPLALRSVRSLLNNETDYICTYVNDTLNGSSVGVPLTICSFDKTTFQINWIHETEGNGQLSGSGFYNLDGYTDDAGNPHYFFDQGPANFTYNFHYDNWAHTKLDSASGIGFCDAQPGSLALNPANYTLINYQVYPYPPGNVAESVTSISAATVPASNISVYCTVGLEEEEQSNSFTVFPNPAANSFTVNLVNLRGGELLRVFDITGKEMLKTNLTAENTQISSEDFPAGIYILQVQCRDGVLRTKLVKH